MASLGWLRLTCSLHSHHAARSTTCCQRASGTQAAAGGMGMLVAASSCVQTAPVDMPEACRYTAQPPSASGSGTTWHLDLTCGTEVGHSQSICGQCLSWSDLGEHMQAERQAAVHDDRDEWAVASSARTIWQAAGHEVRSLADGFESSDQVAAP